MKEELYKLSERIEKGIQVVASENNTKKREELETLLLKLIGEYEDKIKLVEDETDRKILTRLFMLSVRR